MIPLARRAHSLPNLALLRRTKQKDPVSAPKRLQAQPLCILDGEQGKFGVFAIRRTVSHVKFRGQQDLPMGLYGQFFDGRSVESRALRSGLSYEVC
jgi:hypothetical protein